MKEGEESAPRGRFSDIADKILTAIAAPFLRTPGIMAFLMVLCVAAFCYCYLAQILITLDTGRKIIFTCCFMACLLEVWAALFLYNLLLRWSRVAARIWLAVPIAACTLNWLLDVGVATVYKNPFEPNIFAIIAGTNFDETQNFFSTYFSREMFLLLTVTPALAAGAGWLFSRLGAHLRRRVAALPFKKRMWAKSAVPLLLLAALCVRQGLTPEGMFGLTPIWKIHSFFKLDLTTKDLVPANPKVTRTGYSQPLKIVVIVGESHSRSHSSLYGYFLPTQPRLEKLRQDSMLYVVQKPISPALHTVESFRSFIGTYGCEGSDPGLPWYENLTFIELAQKSGYRVSWISNQTPKGFYDNPTKKIADTADYQYYTTDGMRGVTGYCDGVLIPKIRSRIDSTRDLTLVNLYGSHFDYTKRCPEKWKPFRPEDYSQFPERQRYQRCAYDTSIHYNDYVVSELMKLYENEDAVVIYFSDHGQDVYFSHPEYIGHGRDDVPLSAEECSKIPMYIYMSETFKRLHPEQRRIVERLAASSAPYYTTDIIYLLADLMGVTFEVPEKNTGSIFGINFKTSSK